MRSRSLILWLTLLCTFAAQVILCSLVVSLAAYSRRAVYADFSAEVTVMREISGLPYADKINAAGRAYNVSPELITAIIKAESSFQPRALSRAGAYGLMQIIPGTWRLVNSQAGICSGRHAGECGSDCFYNPELNIAVGSCYLSQLLKRYNGQAQLAVAAYNAGPGAVDQYGGIPPYAETTEYVERVISLWYEAGGRVPPGGIPADSWRKAAVVLGWGAVITALMVVAVGRHLFRRYRSFRWR